MKVVLSWTASRSWQVLSSATPGRDELAAITDLRIRLDERRSAYLFAGIARLIRAVDRARG